MTLEAAMEASGSCECAVVVAAAVTKQAFVIVVEEEVVQVVRCIQ